MEPIQPITEEKEKSTPASSVELKMPEVKPAQSRSAVFPILFVVAALLFAGALFFSLRTQAPNVVSPTRIDIDTDYPIEIASIPLVPTINLNSGIWKDKFVPDTDAFIFSSIKVYKFQLYKEGDLSTCLPLREWNTNKAYYSCGKKGQTVITLEGTYTNTMDRTAYVYIGKYRIVLGEGKYINAGDDTDYVEVEPGVKYTYRVALENIDSAPRVFVLEYGLYNYGDIGTIEVDLDRLITRQISNPQQEATGAPIVVPVGKTTCIDSDPKNDIYTKGSVTTSFGGQKTVYDYCSGTGRQISEMWCYESPKGSGNYVNGNMMKDCPNGCYDGRCLKEGEIDPAISSPHLHLLSPKGGETLCMGEEYVIRWEGPKELSTVSLWVHKGTAAAWNIEDLPATFNESNTPGKGEFVWKVGASKKGMIPEGYAYTLGISGNYPQSMRQTNDYFQTDKPFSLINCQG